MDETALEQSALTMARLAVDRPDAARGHVPAFVRSFARYDANLLSRWMSHARARDEAAAGLIAVWIRDYLAKEFVREELGTSTTTQLEAAVSGGANG